MRYLSLCSGIEAASVAWEPLGWTPVAFADIEKFPSAVLKHHYPNVPNLGDITKFKEWPDAFEGGPIDVVCGGTPCQSFSVAGLRKGLADPRGNLSLTFLAIVDKYRPRYVIWENVAGVLSDDEGRSFASIVGGLGQLGYGWSYRVLDAQYVRVDGLGRAVPQRRRRVFVVGYLGDWRRAAAVLSEPEGVLGDSPPRRQAGQGSSASVAPSLVSSGRGVERTGETRGQDPVIAVTTGTLTSAGGNAYSGQTVQDAVSGLLIPSGGPEVDVANCLSSHNGQRNEISDMLNGHIVPVATREVAATLTRGAESSGKGGYAGRRQEDDDNLVAHALDAYSAGRATEDGTGRGVPLTVAHSLRADGFDASEDGTGRGTPLVAQPLAAGMAKSAARMPHEQGALVAFSIMPMNSGKDYKARETDVAQPLMTSPVGGNQGGDFIAQPVAFAQNQRDELRLMDVAGALAAEPGMKQQTYVNQGWAVRRLMPVECERLMGFPDGYTLIPFRGKPAADGPRYKALGNSWAVNCARWIGRRIQMVEELAAEIERERAA